MTPALIPMADQVAGIARAWGDWSAARAVTRQRAAEQVRASRAQAAERQGLRDAILAVLATRPKQWWTATDIVAPLAERGRIQTPTQIGKVLSRAAGAGLVEKRQASMGRRVVFRVGEVAR